MGRCILQEEQRGEESGEERREKERKKGRGTGISLMEKMSSRVESESCTLEIGTRRLRERNHWFDGVWFHDNRPHKLSVDETK